MDLLGSILDKMDAPPASVVDEKEQKRLKAMKEEADKRKEEERKKKVEFREKSQKKVSDFINDQTMTKLKFHDIDKVQRSIVHDIAEVAGLTSFSFGEEDVDRYIILWKKEHAPSDLELEAYRNGKDFDDPTVAAEMLAAAAAKQQEEEEKVAIQVKSKAEGKRPHPEDSKYMDKYEKILGTGSGRNAAKTTGINEAYGMVPSDNKKDQRSIEETLNEIRERKKQKMATNNE